MDFQNMPPQEEGKRQRGDCLPVRPPLGLTGKLLVFLYYAGILFAGNVSFYTGWLCLSPRYPTAVVKKVSGRLVSRMIERAVIMDAKLQEKVDAPVLSSSFPHPDRMGRIQGELTPSHYIEQFVGDRLLARFIVLEGQPLKQVAGIVAGRLHGLDAGGVFRGHRVE